MQSLTDVRGIKLVKKYFSIVNVYNRKLSCMVRQELVF